MKNIPAAVVDTHALAFHMSGGKHLGKRAFALFQADESRQTILYVPAAVIWEYGLLVRAGKLRLTTSLEGFFATLFGNPAYQSLDLTPAQVYLADAYRPNRDPFDTLICAAAVTLDLPLVTRDANIVRAAWVKTVW